MNDNNTANDEKAIRGLLGRWVDASCNKDVGSIMACYAPDVRAFDAIGQLQFQGAEAYRKHWEYCLGFMDGEMLFKIHDPVVTIGGDVAFCHFLATCGCTDENGEEQIGWTRGTVCLRKADGQWQIVHEHYSMPFDPKTMKILDGLKP